VRSHAPRPPTVTPTVTPTVRFTPHVYMYICTPQVAYEGNQDARKLIRAEEVPPPPAQSIGWGGLVRFVRTTVRFVRTNGGQVRVLCGTRNPWSRSRPPPPDPAVQFDPRGLGAPRFDVLVTSYELALSDSNVRSPPAPVRTGQVPHPLPYEPDAPPLLRPHALAPSRRGARAGARALCVGLAGRRRGPPPQVRALSPAPVSA
jgi:hypothetical protein